MKPRKNIFQSSVHEGYLMKKLLLSFLLFSPHVFCSSVEIVSYDSSYKDRILEISFEDKEKFFIGYDINLPEAVKNDMLKMFDAENRKMMVARCDDDKCYKKVLLVDGTVVAFVMYFKTQEQSLESVKRLLKEQGQPDCDEEKLLVYCPHLKKTDAECEQFVLFESIAVAKDFRRKGYARTLVRHVIKDCCALSPKVSKIKLNVNATNNAARSLYKSEGFVESESQGLAFMPGIVCCEKSL